MLPFVQITNAPRSSGKEVTELHEAVRDLVTNINNRYGTSDYTPVLYLERHVPLHERIAFYTIADVAVVTATRDGMNLVPYEYVVCRQGPDGDEELQLPRESMLVVSGGPRGLGCHTANQQGGLLSVYLAAVPPFLTCAGASIQCFLPDMGNSTPPCCHALVCDVSTPPVFLPHSPASLQSLWAAPPP